MRYGIRCIFAAILGCLLLSGSAPAATLIVPDDYGTIQAAIDAARTNDEVLVRPGTYYENIRMKTSVLVKGEYEDDEETIIDGSGDPAPAVLFPSQALDCEIRKFTILQNAAVEGRVAVKVGTNSSGAELHIESNAITGYKGIEVVGDNTTIIENNIIEGCSYAGIHAHGAGPVLDISKNYIGSERSLCDFGILLEGCDGSFIYDTTVSHNIEGIRLNHSNSVEITCSIISNNPEEGVDAIDSDNLLVQLCTFYRNEGNNYVGQHIVLDGCAAAEIRDNIFYLSDYVVWSRSSSVSITYCCKWGGDYWGSGPGEGSFTADPRFTAGYYLDRDGSPCVDSGSRSAQEAWMSDRTTDVGDMPDRGTVDIGYHHPLQNPYIEGHVYDNYGGPMGGVDLRLTGGAGQTKTSGSDGSYIFFGLPRSRPYTVTPSYGNWTFDPGERHTDNLTVPVLNWDFAGTPPPPPPVPTVVVMTNKTHYRAGDEFTFTRRLVNEGPARQVDVYTFLGVGDYFFFYPDWTENIDYQRMTLPEGMNEEEILLQFAWPPNAGSGAADFYAVLTEPGTYSIIGDVSQWSFSWGDKSAARLSTLLQVKDPFLKALFGNPFRSTGKVKLPFQVESGKVRSGRAPAR